MARTLGRAEANSGTWCLLLAPKLNSDPEMVHKLRKNGAFGGYNSWEELKVQCTQLFISSQSSAPSHLYPLSKEEYLCRSNLEASSSRPSETVKKREEDDRDVMVDDFIIIDAEDNLVPISTLPYAPNGSCSEKFYLRGKVDNGSHSHEVMKDISSWKFQYGPFPVFLVKELSGKWIELGQPLKIYALDAFKGVYVVINYLNLVKTNLAASRRFIWNQLRRRCRELQLDPSIQDLLDHDSLVAMLVKKDAELGSSVAIKEVFKKRKTLSPTSNDERKKAREVKNVVREAPEQAGVESTDRENEVADQQESICSICDDGGSVLYCDGPCLRSFHATKADAGPTCLSLGLDPDVKELPDFYCKNCMYSQHQCFSCGKLGITAQEVFVCSHASCGRFYHLRCISRILDSQVQSPNFSCPLHKCFKCKTGENCKYERERLYACRRCPRAWHRKCIEDKIRFVDVQKDLHGDFNGVRGWKNEGTRFLYCLRHKLVQGLKSPPQNHLLFPAGPPK